MGKSRRGSREFNKEQRLANENRKLKREIQKLRKDLARLDLDRHETVREMIEENVAQNPEQSGQEWLDSLKKTWACKECPDGHLQIFLFSKVGTTHYYRVCSNSPICRNRTKSQKYDPNQVRGIIKKDSNGQN